MAQVTTIAVKESTLQILNELKEKTKAKNIDEIIVKLIRAAKIAPVSRFGKQPKLKEFKEKERAKFREF